MASYAPFHVTITTVAGALFDGQATLMTVPSVEGVATILAHHEPLIALLKKGTITVSDTEGNGKEFSIESGVLEVSNNQATVIV
jgi:F-type H+-transporting ATPase subunit epsilon